MEVYGLTKSYDDGGVTALRDMSFALQEGETLGVLGPSGCGKSTLLRLIAGLETPDQGEVRFEGRSLKGVAPHVREFGLMFQDLALFPHLDVFENLAFGLRMRGWPERAVRERVEELLVFMRIPDFARRKVNTLSGGEQQRVALARSLAPRPRLLMLDEPLGALDRSLREELVQEIRRVLRETGVTALYVTHDQDEAFAIAGRVLIMERGRLVQEGTPEEVYLWPGSPFVGRFLGHRNLVPCVAVREAEGVRVESPLGRWLLPLRGAQEMGATGSVTLLVPPEAISLHPGEQGDVVGLVEEVAFREGRYVIRLRIDEDELIAGVSVAANGGASAHVEPGERVAVSVDQRLVRLLPWGLEERAEGSGVRLAGPSGA